MSKRTPAVELQPITRSRIDKLLPKRPHDSHKGMFGTVGVIGGNNGMVGAALLAARAALKMGAGCVHVGLLADNAPGVDVVQPELMLHRAGDLLRSQSRTPHPADETTSHSTRPSKIDAQVAGYPNLPLEGGGANAPSPSGGTPGWGRVDFDVLAIGCGMGHDLASQKLLHDALAGTATLVLDADALNMLAARPDLRGLIAARNSPCVATPHPGEAARLLDCSIDEVQSDRIAAVQRIAIKLDCSVVLKGAGTLCATRDGQLFINKTGNPGMSAAGMGDVLTGMIAAFIAQGLSCDDAMLLAVLMHGEAGDALAQQKAAIGMTATEVTEWARWLLNN